MQVSTIGLDVAKQVFQIHGVDRGVWAEPCCEVPAHSCLIIPNHVLCLSHQDFTLADVNSFRDIPLVGAGITALSIRSWARSGWQRSAPAPAPCGTPALPKPAAEDVDAIVPLAVC
jgi:hypothetical protein